jgi:shikimate kinase
MKTKENIVFLGMMGSGKSSIGSLFSKKLKLDFHDSDKYIENKLGATITKIFKEKGEKFFRECEERMTLDLLTKKNTVIALGGGAFLNKKIRNEVLGNHLSFWLKCDPKILVDRIKKSSKRPIAFNSTNKELFDLIKKRSNIYSKALYTINCNQLTKNELVEKIIDIYEANKVNN